MKPFLKSYRLFLTPLSPIHIGCGEDFEPTNYVIDENILYGFDPSRAVLTASQTGKLADVANRTSLLAIQRFFKENAKEFKAQSDVLIPVCAGVAQAYGRDIGRATNIEANGNQVFNRFFMERSIYTGRLSQPYIPGSSIKGALRTAWLDDLNAGQKPHDVQFKFNGEAKSSNAMEKRLFKGDFGTSPLRLLKIADLMPTQDPARRVMFAVNRKRRKIIKDGKELVPEGIAARKECILQGQYRAFVADAVVLNPKTTPDANLRPTDLQKIAQQSNGYNLELWHKEMDVLDGRGLLNSNWKNSIDSLLRSNGNLDKKLAAGTAFLIRLGRYGGADSKTLSGEGVAKIKIMGAKGQPPTFESTTKTVWLAAEHDSDQAHLLPFGWAIVEIDPQDDAPELKAWCEAEAKSRPDMAALRQQFEQEKAQALQQKAQQQAQAEERAAVQKAEKLAETQRQQALQNMAPQDKAIEALRQKCEDLEKRIATGNFKKQAPEPNKVGLYQEACQLVKKALESSDWNGVHKQALADMLEQRLPSIMAPWDAKDQRKKLKFAALRGQV